MTAMTVSPEDADLALTPWCANNGYARQTRSRAYVHRVVASRMGICCKTVDHINGDKLDNRRCNLRDAGTSGNARNQTKKASGFTSRFKGVYWAGWAKRWRAEITVERKAIKLGYFKSEQDAQDAYAAAAVKYFGAFAAPRVEAK